MTAPITPAAGLDLPVIKHNAALAPLLRPAYSSEAEVRAIWDVLAAKGSLRIPRITGRGLFKAALTGELTESGEDYTGYGNCWVRDSVHVAHALLVQGDAAAAVAAVQDLARFWLAHRSRWAQCIAHTVDFAHDPTVRPHIRFNGAALRENPETWAHAQNDALGYAMWLAVALAADGHLDLAAPLTHPESGEPIGSIVDLLALMTLFMHAVQFWCDADSGHWEEARKVEASSIGPVTAGFRDLLAHLDANAPLKAQFNQAVAAVAAELDVPAVAQRVNHPIPVTAATAGHDLVQQLHAKGAATLAEILPYESRTPGAERATDAALLFLVYPLNVVPHGMARRIVHDVVRDLAGDYGIRRYAGDSYWCAGYKTLLDEAHRTADFSDDMSARDALLKPGQEAQWCIFDSVVACIYGEWARDTAAAPEQRAADRAAQAHFFNRAVGQVTGDDCAFGAWHCPESYYIEDAKAGKYVVNDVCPLLWTSANMIKALDGMVKTVRDASSA
ncbi:hypothetical protein H9P43_000983 [Blastocladiella emersonii ATCC 22665]|nr:hypothetical protein H9P43_000983 [Blastocladiella emersonii ATCC 22665]